MAATAAGAVVAGFAMFQAWQFLYPPVAQQASTDPACDLHRAECMATLADGRRIVFGMTPRPIPLIAPLRLSVRITGFEASYAEVEFTSPDMNMGFNRNALAAEGASQFSGKAVLPVCTLATMNWHATVRLHTPSGIVAALFPFSTFNKDLSSGN